MRQPAPVWHTGIWICFYFALMGLQVWSAGRASHPRSESSSLVGLYLIDFAASVLALLFIWWGLARNKYALSDLIGFRWSVVRDPLLAIGFVAANWFMVVTLAALFGKFSIHPTEVFRHPRSQAEFLVMALVLGGAGFFEEITFRGYLLRQALSLTGTKSFAIAVQAFFFSVAHGLDQTIVGFFAKFVFGWLLGELAVRRRSLLPGMLAHTLNNLLALAVMSMAG